MSENKSNGSLFFGDNSFSTKKAATEYVRKLISTIGVCKYVKKKCCSSNFVCSLQFT